jgi:excisionase family DNA binding protein
MDTTVNRSTASNPLPDLWDSDYTARYLHCSLGTLLKLAQAGEIPAVKIGRGWVFDPVKVRAWLDAKMEGQK